MSSFGNRSFQGLGFKADAARRLDDLARSVSALEEQLKQAKSQSTPVVAIPSSAGPTKVLDITNAVGQPSTQQKFSIPKVFVLPPTGSPLAFDGSLVDLNGQLYRYNGTTNKWELLGSSLLQDTHANRLALYPATSYLVGQLFWETNSTLTDRQSLYVVQQISGVNQWAYVCGLYIDLFANRPTDLGLQDVGFEFRASDYLVTERWNGTGWSYLYGVTVSPHGILATLAAVLIPAEAGWLVQDTTYVHTFRWNGSGWEFNDGETSQYTVGGDQAPAGGLWYLCDGANHDCVNSDGTIRSVPTQDTTVTAAVMTGAWNATINPATAMTYQAGTTLSAATPTLDPKPPSVAAGGLPAYYTGPRWLRA